MPSRLFARLAGLLPALALAAAACCPPAAAQTGLALLRQGDMPVALVYPTAAPASPQAFGPVTLQVARDAAPLPGRRRLVLLSHGTGGSWVSDHALAATLAAAGFVVAQPLHRRDNFRDASGAGPDSWATRPGDVSAVIDMLAADPAWQGRLQLDRVGVHGMSAGGGTALVLAGAQWRLLDLLRHCDVQGEADFGFCYSGLTDASAQARRRAQFESIRGVPAQFLPAALTTWHGGPPPAASGAAPADTRPDPRIASVSVAVPVAAIFSTESLQRIRVPVGVVAAGLDTWLPPPLHSARLLRDCPACTLLADLPGAAHMDLLAPWPQALAEAEAARQPRGGAPAPGFDAAQRQAAFQAVADFHRRHLGP